MKHFSFSAIHVRNFASIIICGLGLLTLTACLKDTEYFPENVVSGLTVIHAAPDAPPFDFILNGELILGNIPYPKRIIYFSGFPGTYQAKFYRHLSFTDPLYKSTLTLSSGKYYSLFLVGTLKDSLSMVIINDDLKKPKTGNSKLRFINLSPDIGPIDFTIDKDSLFAKRKNFKEYTSFHEIPAGRYNAQFSTPNLTYPSRINLEEGKTYTLWIRGLVNTDDEAEKINYSIIVHDK